jgi:hypothetical protein
VDHPLRTGSNIPPGFWRSAAVVASLVAVVELVLLVVSGTALLLRDDGSPAAPAARTAAEKTPAAKPTKAPAHAAVRKAPPAKLARAKVDVMVLNGNGRQGAAAAAADRIRHHGYKIGFVGNASRMTYGRSLVMYRPGFEGEGRRLAHDLGIRSVGPLDGMRLSQLRGAKVVFILGA